MLSSEKFVNDEQQTDEPILNEDDDQQKSSIVVKVKEIFEKTRHIKKNDKSKKYILRGHRSTRYHEKRLSNKKKTYNLYFYNVNFSKIIIDTKLKFSTYTNILTSYRMMYHTLLQLKFS